MAGNGTPDGSVPIMLHLSQWQHFKREGFDMRWFKLHPRLIPKRPDHAS